MCYTDIITNDDGTASVWCYCGWSEDHDTPEAADEAAERHENAAASDYTADNGEADEAVTA